MLERTSNVKKERSRFKKILVDSFAGTIAGINVTIFGHPFDTLKVRLQTQSIQNPVYSGVIDCFKKTLKWEGVSGFYTGIHFPLIGQMLYRANMFFAYGESKRYFSQSGRRKVEAHEYYLAGSIACAWGVLLECPIDFFKTQMQIQIINSKSIQEYRSEFSGIIDCFKKIISRNGPFGAYQGFFAHLCRNIPGGAFLLGTFEIIRLQYAQSTNIELTEVPITITLFAASVGGVLFWLPTFPFDVVKSAIQGDSPFKENKKYFSTLDAWKKLYDEGGCKRFYKGLSPCIIRAIPANGILLLTSSYLSECL